MKTVQRFFAAALSLLLLAVLAVPAYAAGDVTITIEQTAEGHTYDVYQIFTGDVATETTGEGSAAVTTTYLSNVAWGSSVTDEGRLYLANLNGGTITDASAASAASAAENLTGTTVDAAAVAKALVDGKNGTSYLVDPVASIIYDSSKGYTASVAPGYYLILDQAGSLDESADPYTSYILQVVGSTTITPKTSTPTVEKQIVVQNSDGTETTQDSANYAIWDTVSFRLTGTLPSNYADYTSYSYTFTDTLSAGFTMTDTNGVKVSIVNGAGSDETKTDVTSYFTVSKLSDAAADPGDPYENGKTFTVAITDLKAIESLTIDSNSKIVVEYTAALNSSAVIGTDGNPNKVTVSYSNDPYDSSSEAEKNTPEDEVKVYTFQLVVNKTDGSNNALPGADFKLEKFVADSEGTATYNGEKGTWQPISYQGTWNEQTTSFTFNGLSAGVYRLTETTTPAGYNTSEEKYFKVASTPDTSGVYTPTAAAAVNESNVETSIAFSVSSDTEQTITTTIVNNRGTVLPSTGGIGTTVFYILGGGLMAAAAVLLIVKKRMNNSDDE